MPFDFAQGDFLERKQRSG